MANNNSQSTSEIKPRPARLASESVAGRPPIVAVLGHVDHGKTTLLDRIRKTSVASREVGGITQSIGAWSVKTPKNETVTFIDTPGHEAFKAMRERGAKVADIVILVVAADDGVMPQTKESLKYINESQTPFLVAITKVDLPTAQIERAKNQLMSEGILLEGYGGDVPIIEVSAKTGQGVEDLLEMIILMAEVNEVSGDPEGSLEAYVIESRHDRRKGVVASLVIKNGSIKSGDELYADKVRGKARGLFDEFEKSVSKVLPGMPVEIIGFSGIPAVGSRVVKSGQAVVEEKPRSIIPKVEGFPIVLKVDSSGSLEAILGQLPPDVGILYCAVGDISESDVLNASTAGAAIIGFNVRAGKEIERLSEGEHVKIYTYRIIYELLQDLDKMAKGEIEHSKDKILGKAEIIAHFPHDKLRIAGCKLVEGRIAKSDRLRLIRGEKVLGNIRLISLKKQKEEVDKVVGGEEFGMLFEPQFDFQVKDVIESFQERQSA